VPHGGVLDIESTPPCGTTVRLAIPLDPDARSPMPTHG
jgi:signal transduction histidine kinase